MIEPVVSLSALEHHAYCPRQAALIHVDGAWLDNADIIRGQRGHTRVDAAPSRVERGRRVLRGMPLWSEQLGLTGRADVIEVHPDGSIEPVEYKHGVRHGQAAEIQVCSQGLCLEEMLDTRIDAGAVWYAGFRQRQPVDFDDDLRRLTIETIGEVRDALATGDLPGAPNDDRCSECQLLPYCLPGLVAEPALVTAYVRDQVFSCA